jgi:hypothetical protein
MNTTTQQASANRDQAAIDRQRSKYQYNNEMPLAPRHYGMPHQARKKGVRVKPQLEVTSMDGEEDATQGGVSFCDVSKIVNKGRRRN